MDKKIYEIDWDKVSTIDDLKQVLIDLDIKYHISDEDAKTKKFLKKVD